MNRQHILFVHVPKTAGTSFRLAIKDYMQSENFLCDYGAKQEETSNVILDFVYKQKDLYLLHKYIQNKDQLFLCGHFGVGKYMAMFETLNVCTFLRDPIDQVLSHYKHFLSYHNYTKDIKEFIKDERFKNIQSKYLKAKPLELYGFIGITEEYEKSIELFNYTFGMNIDVIHVNESINNFYVDESIIELIKQENQEDLELYSKAKKIFYDRWESYKNKRPYVYKWIQELRNDTIKGVAFIRNSDEIISIDLMDGQNKVTIQAKSFRPGLLHHNLPRSGYVGFEYRSKNKVKLI